MTHFSCRRGFLACLFVLATTATQGAEPPQVDWKLETPQAEWKARDSSGELVFNNQLWIFGGWHDSYSPPPRDAWSSADGKTWKLVTDNAPWKYSDLPMTLTFKDQMWFMGGWTNGRIAGHGATSEVWSSTDGKNWKHVTPKAEWSPRAAAGAVVFKDRMWILGGTENYYFGDDSHLKNDVWSSADGQHWTQATAAAPWSPRSYLQAAVLGDKMYVIAGGNYVPTYHAKNDVWSSTDGVNWTLENDNPPFHPRLWFSAVTYRDHLWVIGGWSNNPSRNWGDTWYSADGKNWKELKSNVVWKARHEHSTYVFQDKIWVAAGHAMPLSQEVWSLELPTDFFSK